MIRALDLSEAKRSGATIPISQALPPPSWWEVGIRVESEREPQKNPARIDRERMRTRLAPWGLVLRSRTAGIDCR
jgi:hypothetical protein